MPKETPRRGQSRGQRIEPDPTKPLFGFQTTAEFLEYVEHLPAEESIAISQQLWKRPDLMVELVKIIRSMASDAALTPADRAEARRVMLEHGFDDDTLKREDSE